MRYNITLDIDPKRLVKSAVITLVTCLFALAVYMTALSAMEAMQKYGIDVPTLLYGLIVILIAVVFKIIYDNEGRNEKM